MVNETSHIRHHRDKTSVSFAKDTYYKIEYVDIAIFSSIVSVGNQIIHSNYQAVKSREILLKKF